MKDVKDPEVDWVEIHLPNHTPEDYADILNLPDHTVPESVSYEMESALDVDPEVEEPEGDGKGENAFAWVDFVGGHAVVGLNPAFYADTPADELTEVAEDILLRWATYYRQGAELPEEME
jgi:hypothetical protein